jgi:hypothetical protein
MKELESLCLVILNYSTFYKVILINMEKGDWPIIISVTLQNSKFWNVTKIQ